MLFDQSDEVPLRIAAERRYAEVRIGADESRGLSVQVREIAAPAARHQYLLADPVRAFKYDHATAALSCDDRTHEASGPSTNDDYVGVLHAVRIAVLATLLRGVYPVASTSSAAPKRRNQRK